VVKPACGKQGSQLSGTALSAASSSEDRKKGQTVKTIRLCTAQSPATSPHLGPVAFCRIKPQSKEDTGIEAAGTQVPHQSDGLAKWSRQCVAFISTGLGSGKLLNQQSGARRAGMFASPARRVFAVMNATETGENQGSACAEQRLKMRRHLAVRRTAKSAAGRAGSYSGECTGVTGGVAGHMAGTST
jgi:hypothetical protein